MSKSLEKRIEDAIDTSLEDTSTSLRERRKLKQNILKQVRQNKREEEKEEAETGVDKDLTRRKFLKMLGIGTGGLALSSSAAGLFKITDQPQTSTINADTIDGNQASNFATANDLSNHAGVTGAHHTKYTDENAQDAVGTILGSNLNYDDTNNNISLNQGSGSGLDSDQVDGFDIQKNGNNTNGVINLDTNNNTITVDGDIVVAQVLQATGGTTVTTFTDNNGQRYKIHAFENTGTNTFTVSSAPPNSKVDVLVVGGGGGGRGGGDGGGAGGAGGLVFAKNVPISPSSIGIVVGDGGGSGSQGNDSYFDQNGTSELRAIGGGRGGRYEVQNDNLDGGSGGGSGATDGVLPMNEGQALQPGTNNLADGEVVHDEGSPGGDQTFDANDAGSSGGGATQAGEGLDFRGDNNQPGGDGRDMSNKFGSSFGENGVFAGGGGGHHRNSSTDGPGGVGGGGRGTPGDGNPGQPNTGGGGGSAGGGGNGGNGGSGIVLIRFPV
jgi:hypothetical protein